MHPSRVITAFDLPCWLSLRFDFELERVELNVLNASSSELHNLMYLILVFFEFTKFKLRLSFTNSRLDFKLLCCAQRS